MPDGDAPSLSSNGGGRKPIHKKRRYENGALYLQCFCDSHNGEWVLADKFNIRRQPRTDGTIAEYPRYICKEGEARYRLRQKYGDTINKGRVAVADVQAVIEEIVARCGSYKAAGKATGIHYMTILAHLGRFDNRNQRRMNKQTALKYISTLMELRRNDQHVNGNKPQRNFRKGCKGCGRLDLDNFTEGCKVCLGRKLRRDSRRRELERS